MNKVNKELFLLLSLFAIAVAVQFFAESLPMALCFYSLPTLFSAYTFGRRHATLTAFACVFLVVMLNFIDSLFPAHPTFTLPGERLFNFAIWAGMLVVTAYAMGTLYERRQEMTNDIRESSSSLLVVLQHFLASDKYSEHDAAHVAMLATKIAEVMDLGSDRTECVRSAALLRDLSKLGISNEILYKAANLTRDEVIASFHKGTRRPDERAQTMGGRLRRVLPIIVAQQILAEQGARAMNVPIEAHILAVADTYQRLISGLNGKVFSPQQAEATILSESGGRFNTGVVDAFVKVCSESARGAGAGV
ncbi:MAG TPA: HD domain-containing phosphohydrolase [Terriglobales bacterium]|nr:HD domain-containing phosphohydrolase [Terriglobales bacterium]